MSREEVQERIQKVMETEIGASVSERENLKESGIDSLTLVSVIAAIEEEFNICFSDDDLMPVNLETVFALAELTEKYL